MHLKIFIALSLLVHAVVYAQKPISISGKILDADNGETIIGAIVADSLHNAYTTTDETGRFTLKSISGVHHLALSHVGFQAAQHIVSVQSDTTLIFQLSSVKLHTVEIVSSALPREQLMPGLVKIPVAQLNAVPAIAGETDVLKALSLTPGVNEGVEGTTGLFVRGGTPDQNLILLDDAVVYNPSHLYGFVSVFNPKVLKDVKLIKGGFPARYGGRASSVIDITTKEGNTDHFCGSGGIGLINSDLLLEGPIRQGKSSFLLAGRAAYMGLLLLPQILQYKAGATDEATGLSVYDINAKYTHQFNENNKFILSAYTGSDALNAYQSDGDIDNKAQLKWGNITTTARYQTLIANKVSAKFMALYTGYRYNLSALARDSTHSKLALSLQESDIDVAQFQTDLSYPVTRNYLLRVGTSAAQSWFAPTRLTATDYVADTTYSKNLVVPTFNIATYMDHEWDISKKVFTNIGLRYVTNWSDDTVFTSLEPRVTLGFKMAKNWSLSMGYSINRQFLHLLSLNGGSGLPNEIWAPATRKARPSTTSQTDLYLRKYVPKIKTEISLSGYLKSMFDLIEYREGIGFVNRFNNDWESVIETQGRGLSYGAELFVHKQAGKLNGWLGYTLAWSNRRFPIINNHEVFPAPYDRRHSLEIFGQYTLSDVWKVGGTWVLQSGAPITLPVAQASGWNPSTEPFSVPYYGSIYDGRNNARLPTYHRLDLSVTCTFNKGFDRIGELSFGAYNVYGRINPLYYEIDSRKDPVTGFTERYLKGTAPFVFIPSIKYSLTFK